MIPGPLLFARYALPPNARGLCGPDEHAELRDYARAGVAGPGLARLAAGFEGAWPYLQLIAAANQLADPLDRRVVEAYWVGNDLLDGVPVPAYGTFLEDRFRARAGRAYERIARTVPAGAVPHHSCHVFLVYPWAGLLREGRAEPSLRILDSCRISWGRVLTAPAGDDTVLVRRRPLRWDGHRLGYGPAVPHRVAAGFVTGLKPGEWVSLHWDCVCDRLGPRQLLALSRFSARHLRLADRDVFSA